MLNEQQQTSDMNTQHIVQSVDGSNTSINQQTNEPTELIDKNRQLIDAQIRVNEHSRDELTNDFEFQQITCATEIHLTKCVSLQQSQVEELHQQTKLNQTVIDSYSDSDNEQVIILEKSTDSNNNKLNDIITEQPDKLNTTDSHLIDNQLDGPVAVKSDVLINDSIDGPVAVKLNVLINDSIDDSVAVKSDVSINDQLNNQIAVKSDVSISVKSDVSISIHNDQPDNAKKIDIINSQDSINSFKSLQQSFDVKTLVPLILSDYQLEFKQLLVNNEQRGVNTKQYSECLEQLKIICENKEIAIKNNRILKTNQTNQDFDNKFAYQFYQQGNDNQLVSDQDTITSKTKSYYSESEPEQSESEQEQSESEQEQSESEQEQSELESMYSQQYMLPQILQVQYNFHQHNATTKSETISTDDANRLLVCKDNDQQKSGQSEQNNKTLYSKAILVCDALLPDQYHFAFVSRCNYCQQIQHNEQLCDSQQTQNRAFDVQRSIKTVLIFGIWLMIYTWWSYQIIRIHITMHQYE